MPVAPRDVRTASGFEVTTHGGRQGTGIDAIEWVERAQQLGAGEILLNSMDADGTREGFDVRMICCGQESDSPAAGGERWCWNTRPLLRCGRGRS